MKIFDKHIQKKLNELDKRPEKNKSGKLSQEQTQAIIKIVMFLILFAFFIYLCYFRTSYTQRIRG